MAEINATNEEKQEQKEQLKMVDKKLSKNIEFLSWMQEFSKKVVTITFFIFILGNIFFFIMLGLYYYATQEIIYIDTFISELHVTFREVIGGYMVKAAAENVIKIGGGYMESYMVSKKTVIEQQVVAASGISTPTPAPQNNNQAIAE